MHIFNLDLHPEGGLQFLGVDDIVKINIDSDGYDGYLLEYIEQLELLKKKHEPMYIGMCDFVLQDTPERLNKHMEGDYVLSMAGGWQEYDGEVEYQIHLSFDGCCVWLNFANVEELQFFINYVSQWHDGLIEAQEISDF